MPTPLTFQRPRGVVIYPDNNSRKRDFAYYKKGSAIQNGAKKKTLSKCTGSHSHLRKYLISMLDGSEITVAAAKTLDKNAKSNPAYVPDTWEDAGYLNYETLIDASGNMVAKHDSSGEFRQIGFRMKQLYALPDSLIVPFENVHDDLDTSNDSESTHEHFFDALEGVSESGLDFFAYAGHGGKKSLPSAKVNWDHIQKLTNEIRRLCKPDGTVIFYACSTGAPAGFASKVSSKLPTMTVWGHTDAGQASRNADKIRYRNGAGTDIRDLLSAGAKAKWASYLLESPDFYARFPFMSIEDIEAELASV